MVEKQGLALQGKGWSGCWAWGPSIPSHLVAGSGSGGAGGGWRRGPCSALGSGSCCGWTAQLQQALFVPPSGGPYIRHKLFPGLMFDFLGRINITGRESAVDPPSPALQKGLPQQRLMGVGVGEGEREGDCVAEPSRGAGCKRAGQPRQAHLTESLGRGLA